MLLLDPEAPEERRSEILREAEAMIGAGGEVTTQQDWGTRRMTFEIDHRPEAAYHLIQFEGEPPVLERLRSTLRIADGVLRFRIIRIKPGTPPPVPPRPEARRDEQEEPEGKVAARAAADAPDPAPAEAPGEAAPTEASAAVEAPVESAPEAPAGDAAEPEAPPAAEPAAAAPEGESA
jgi:small subunit ribosomal protein S6